MSNVRHQVRLLLNAPEVELLSALARCHARYLIIGGHAVIFHGYLRPAKDLDLWVEPTEVNAARVARALSTVHVHLRPEHVERLSRANLQMQVDGLNTELLTSVTGLIFEEAMARSSVAFEGSVSCQVLALGDLIQYKRLVGRDRDLEDIRQLEALKARGA
jgi:hypothetical protein